MAVTSFPEHWSERGGFHTEEGEIGVTRIFKPIATNDQSDDQHVILNYQAAGVPQLRDAHPSEPRIRVVRRSAEPLGPAGTLWQMRVKYSNKNDPDDEYDNPLDKPVRRSTSTTKLSRPIWKDKDDTAILNKAGDFFEGLEIPYSHTVVRFVRNEATHNIDYASTYIDTVNSATFLGQAAGLVRCNDISATEQFEDDTRFWEVTYEFEIAKESWKLKILNAGLYENDSGRKYPCLDENGGAVTQPVPLDSNGVQIAVSLLPGAAVILEFDVYEESDFNVLGLPDT